MPCDPIPTWYFVLVVVRLVRRFLLIQERKHGQHWYLRAGRVEPGENLVASGERETLEESGVAVVIEGIVRIEYSPHPDGTARLRVILVAHPEDDTAPKSAPDQDTLGAAWVSLEELETLPLRGKEREIFHYVAAGGPIYPIGMITQEGAPFRPR